MSFRRRALGALGAVLTICSVGCRTAQRPPPLSSAPQRMTVEVDYAHVFGGASSLTLADARMTGAALMERVLVERALLVTEPPPKQLERWTRRALISTLGAKGSTLLVLPVESAECRGGSCLEPPPTAALHDVELISARDEHKIIVVEKEPGLYAVSLRTNPRDASLCADDLELTIGFVRFTAWVQRLPDGALVSLISELATLGPPKKPTLSLETVSPAENPEQFCAAIVRAFEAEPGFARDDLRFEEAAANSVSLAVDLLLMEPLKPPEMSPTP